LQLYVINLDRSVDRLAHIRDIFAAQGLEFIRVRAVDGKALSEQEFAKVTQRCDWPRPLTRGEVGCFLSHRECLQRGLEQGEEYFAVFEDDVLLSPHVGALLRNPDWIMPDTDMVKLDTAGKTCLLEPLRKIHLERYSLGRLVSKHFCTGGYIISRQAARRILALTEQAFAPIDEIYFNPLCGVLQKTNVLQLVPAVVVQTGHPSTIRHDPSLYAGKNRRRRARSNPRRPFMQRLRREGQRIYHRFLRPFWLKWLRGYYWGKIPFA